jgi:acetyl esterase/lipase
MMSSKKVPPFDPELAEFLALYPSAPTTVTREMIPMLRQTLATPPETVIGNLPIRYTERCIPGPIGAPDLTVAILERHDRPPGGPGVCYLHPGGMTFGDRWFGLDPILSWVTDLDSLVMSVEYRLAPENPYPAAIDDSYSALHWLAANHDVLGFDPDRLVVAGASAGGGLAAGVSLKVRDEGGPHLAAQVLIYPMLDDRNVTVSSHQFDGFGRWDRGSNITGWNSYLGDRWDTDSVPCYAAPARATDLSNLPPTYIDVGSAELFRDEAVAFAVRIWADGGTCELHVWSGGFHAFDKAVPEAVLSQAMIETRAMWLKRALGC